MAPKTLLPSDDIEWLKTYEAEVMTVFTAELRAAADRFLGWQHLIDRFGVAVDSVLKYGRSHFSAVDEAHNELCIASAILSNAVPRIERLDYEPKLIGSERSIDFLATAENSSKLFIDVKTVKPKSKDRWDQFQRALDDGWLPENVTVVLSKNWLGGELWHGMFTARARMLEYTLELESKIAEGRLSADNTRCIMAFCGAGFDWHENQLEDFVSFYFSGQHRGDDPFSLAEQKYMQENNISLSRTISSFACMSRPQGMIRQRRLNWRVQAPSPQYL